MSKESRERADMMVAARIFVVERLEKRATMVGRGEQSYHHLNDYMAFEAIPLHEGQYVYRMVLMNVLSADGQGDGLLPLRWEVGSTEDLLDALDTAARIALDKAAKAGEGDGR